MAAQITRVVKAHQAELRDLCRKHERDGYVVKKLTGPIVSKVLVAIERNEAIKVVEEESWLDRIPKQYWSIIVAIPKTKEELVWFKLATS